MNMPGSHINRTLAETFLAKMEFGTLQKEPFWYANEANLMRICALHLQGGIYLDTDVILTNEVLGGSITLDRVMSQVPHEGKWENAVMKFNEPKNPFVAEVVHNMIENYDDLNYWNETEKVKIFDFFSVKNVDKKIIELIEKDM